MKRFIVILLILSIFIQNSVVFASAYNVNTYDASFTEKGISVSSTLPEIDDLKDVDLLNDINTRIKNIYDSKVQNAEKEKASSVNIEYEKIVTDNIVSLLIYSTTSTDFYSKAEVDTITFDTEECKYLTITDVLGSNAQELINKFIAASIKQNPERFNPEFRGVGDNISFYVENDNFVILFNQYEIAPGYEGIVRFSMKISDVCNVYVSREDYIVLNDNYNLKMMPMRQVCEGLGFSVYWDSLIKATTISKGLFSTKIIQGKNSYFPSLNVSRELETAPVVQYGKTFLPISFFTAILGATYKIDDNDNIMFSIYKAK